MKKTLRRWSDAASKWVDLLWLNDHRVIYRVEPREMPKRELESPAAITAATCESNPRYKYMVMTVDEDYIKSADKKEINETACHEALHAVIAPLNEVAWEAINALPASKREGWHNYRRYALEFVTQHLTNVAQHLHKSPKGE